MKQIFDLAALDWTVSGWAPHHWRLGHSLETEATTAPEVRPLPACVPGSVQQALLNAAKIPDWNSGLNSNHCEWVENRHWIFAVSLPPESFLQAGRTRLRCLGLDYCGCVLLNGKHVGTFQGSFVPWAFDLTELLLPGSNRLSIVFECPPRWLGQFGYTSQMTEWKPRFHYFWDWTSRLVQVGIWDSITLESDHGDEIETLRCTTEAEITEAEITEAKITEAETHGGSAGTLRLQGRLVTTFADHLQITLEEGSAVLRRQDISVAAFQSGIVWQNLPIELWQPNRRGAQKLYLLRCCLLSPDGQVLDETTRRVGFKSMEWQPCEGAPQEADPWLCVVNGSPLFLQGVNWTPIRPNFADVGDDEYRQRLKLYRDFGCNLIRVWGGGFLEKEIFYDLCDELGLLVWQEMPLSSSGVDNWPPEDEKSIAELVLIARSYLERRQHHVSLSIWCGGNELQGAYDGSKIGAGKPIDASHPLMAKLAGVFAQEDPSRRFLATSSSGPHFTASEERFGQGVHWDVHGPWVPEGPLGQAWTDYWQRDDALFRSETGAAGASPADILHAYAGNYSVLPVSLTNPLWNRSAIWIEAREFLQQTGHEPADLEDYVGWSQSRQANALSIAVRACKQRFPRCGGIVIWSGHDSFPCMTNTSLVDFWGRPKPAALAVAEIFCQE